MHTKPTALRLWLRRAVYCMPLLVLAALLAGCAAPPPPSCLLLPPSARVGIVNLLEEHATHIHVGTTAFTNFEEQYEVAWKIPEAVELELVRQLARAGYQAVAVPPPAVLLQFRDQLVHTPLGGSPALDPEFAPDIERIGRDYRVDVLLVIKSYQDLDPRGQSGLNTHGYGLFTRSLLFVRFLGYAHARIHIEAFLTEPPTYAGGARHRLVAGDLPAGMDLPALAGTRDIPDRELDRLAPLIREDIPGMAMRALQHIGIGASP